MLILRVTSKEMATGTDETRVSFVKAVDFLALPQSFEFYCATYALFK